MRQAGLFVLVSEAYLAAPPTLEMVRLSRGRGHSRVGVESAVGDHAAGWRPRQAKTGLTTRRGTAGDWSLLRRIGRPSSPSPRGDRPFGSPGIPPRPGLLLSRDRHGFLRSRNGHLPGQRRALSPKPAICCGNRPSDITGAASSPGNSRRVEPASTAYDLVREAARLSHFFASTSAV